MANSDVTRYIEKVVEDGVKTGLAGAGISTATTIGNVVNDWPNAVIGFVSGFFVSVVFSLISQPFGNRASNHIFGNAPTPDALTDSLDSIVTSIASESPKE